MKLTTLFTLALTVVQVTALDQNEKDSWIDQILHDIEQAVTCGGCEILLGTLKGLSGLGEDALVDTLTGVCDIAKIEDSDVCSGILQAEGPSVYHALQTLTIGSDTSKTLCANLAGLCDYPAPRSYDLNLTSKPNTTRPPPSGKSPIRVAHISDTHVDLSYTPGSNYNCTKPICCRVYEPSDAPGNTSAPCGDYGNQLCDAPLRLEESMVAAIEKLDPAFSIYTGDVVAHDIWSVNKSEALDDFNATYSLLDRLSPVYAAVGNHDSAPVNIFPPTSDPDNEWAYQALFSDWEELSTSITSRTPHGSYTSLTRDKKLKIISYNSIFYYTLNFAMYTDPMANDPANQLKWLLDELDSAESASQRVWLIAHIPTGNSDHLRDQSDYLDRIINRYSETISALFFGHTHKDQFQVSYSDYDNRNSDTASAIGYVAPSLTPTSGLPAFRVYEIDPETYAVLDYTMYVANITAEGFQEGPEWVEYYSAKKAYGSHVGVGSGNGAELTPAFWHNVTVAMEGDDAVFEAWLSRTTRGVDVPDCDADCKKAKICQLRGGDAVYNCHKATPGLSINKRDTDTGPECDEGGSGALLARMFTMYR